MPERTDIFISGGGIAGLVAAATFARQGREVVLADPAPPPAPDPNVAGSDLRSTAYLRPARGLLEDIGLWQDLARVATPLAALEVIETTGWPPSIRARRRFEGTEVSDGPFGWNIPNWTTRTVLVEALARMPGVDMRLGVGFNRLLSREGAALIELSDGTRLEARLAVGADGHRSPLRTASGIGIKVHRYGQKALAFTVTHPLQHQNISTEIYNSGGAFTLVPIARQKGIPASAVVWMEDGTDAGRLHTLEADAFNAEMTERSCSVLGPLALASPRSLWPVVTQTADALTARRVALIAEAAHVLPPIGAQGLNTSLHDVAALADAMSTAEDPGDPTVLDAFRRSRAGDIRLRSAAIDLFNRVCQSGEPAVSGLRLAGLRAVADFRPLRTAVMRAGLGPSRAQ